METDSGLVQVGSERYLDVHAGYMVELASPAGGVIPLDPRSVTPEMQRRCPDVRRFLADGVRLESNILS